MDLHEHLAKIRNDFSDKLQTTSNETIGGAVSLLREDIKDPEFNNSKVPPDTFMLRANQVGLALLQQGYFSVAERLYRILVKETLEYREETGNWRHAGALYANTATACAAQRNLDQAVVELLKASQEDIRTYGISPEKSFAITDLLQEYFGKPVRQEATNIVQTVNHNITLADVENLSNSLDKHEYAFLAYMHIAFVHIQANQQSPNEFSRLQVFGALRSLSALLEIVLKTLASDMDTTFFPALQNLFSGKGWWTTFNNTRLTIRGPRDANRAIDDQLQDAIALSPTDDISRFWKSLLIAYIVRNYTTHQMDTNSALIQSYTQEAFGHILHVMITASRYV